MTGELAPARQDRRFLWLYAIAFAGGSIAYVPFLTLLLPMRMTALAGAEDVTWLAYATFAGAVAASGANILFGWASDLSGTRRAWIAAGLTLTSLLLPAFSLVEHIAQAIALLVLWQVTLNMMLAPLAAWAGDCVPDQQKGELGGLLAFAPAAGALAGVIGTLPGLASADDRLWLIAGLTVLCVAPVLLLGRPRAFPELTHNGPAETRPRASRSKVARMWLARLLVQVSEAAMFAFLYFWLRSLESGLGDASTSRIFASILLGSIPLALMAGRWADRHERPFVPLIGAALGAVAGLALMALARGLASGIAGYVVFGLSAAVFLALHTAQTLRVLPLAQKRGRDLGLFNLTNTGPSLVMPWLTLALVPQFGFSGLFAALAFCALGAALLLVQLARSR